jgi:hypothetical protein
MHRSITTDVSVKEYGVFAIQQYNKAISYVVRPSKPLSPIVILVACWMFSCFEVMRGDHKVLGRHLTSGLQLISSRGSVGHGEMAPEYGLDTNAENRAIQECLIQQFSVLDLQMMLYEPDWVSASMQYCQQPRESISFSSMSQARHHLTTLLLRVVNHCLVRFYNLAMVLRAQGRSITRQIRFRRWPLWGRLQYHFRTSKIVSCTTIFHGFTARESPMTPVSR